MTLADACDRWYHLRVWYRSIKPSNTQRWTDPLLSTWRGWLSPVHEMCEGVSVLWCMIGVQVYKNQGSVRVCGLSSPLQIYRFHPIQTTPHHHFTYKLTPQHYLNHEPLLRNLLLWRMSVDIPSSCFHHPYLPLASTPTLFFFNSDFESNWQLCSCFSHLSLPMCRML